MSSGETGAAGEYPELGRILPAIRNRWRIESHPGLDQAPQQFLPPQAAADDDDGSSYKSRLTDIRKPLRALQRQLQGGKQYSVLLVFQALDAAGKDGAIREVLQGLDAGGVSVTSFKRPSRVELEHDFLWRTSRALPRRGTIGAFNRSHYEEVLAVKVHPEFLDAQYAGSPPAADTLWPQRYRAIREHERHLASANTVVLKFWLNVSLQRQAERFLERLENPAKHWKFSAHDVFASNHREQYDEALRDLLNETSRPWAPWFCIPADDRWYARWQIADILRQALELLPLRYPPGEDLGAAETEQLKTMLRERVNGQ